MGAISHNKIIYNGEKAALTNSENAQNCYILLLSCGLKLTVDYKDCSITGIVGVLDKEKLIEDSTEINGAIEGKVIFIPEFEIVNTAHYPSDYEFGTFYDEGILRIGEADDDCLIVRTAENMFVSLRDDKLCGIIIRDVLIENKPQIEHLKCV